MESLQPASRAKGRPLPAAQSTAAAAQNQALVQLGARCLMGAWLCVSVTSAAASSAAERGEWQPRRHHRRLEKEEMREYTQAAISLPSAIPKHSMPHAKTALQAREAPNHIVCLSIAGGSLAGCEDA